MSLQSNNFGFPNLAFQLEQRPYNFFPIACFRYKGTYQFRIVGRAIKELMISDQ